MRISELSAASGVPTHTIKYYLREGLLGPGRTVNRTSAEYDESHLRDLTLIRALVTLRGLPIRTVRDVLHQLRQPDVDLHQLLGLLVGSTDPDPEPDDATGSPTLAEVVERMEWDVHPGTRPIRAIHDALQALADYGMPMDADDLLGYARAAQLAAEADFADLAALQSRRDISEHALVRTFLLDSVLVDLRRLAQENLSRRRFGPS